jgi:predicted RND superfamily exporter protein
MVAIYATFELSHALPGYVNLQRAIEKILSDEDDGTFSVYLSGPVVVVAGLSIQASRVAYFFPLALIVIGLIHYDAFRTWQAVFLPLATGILAVVWALGLMGHLGVPLDPFNSTTPVLILAVGAGHAVQILKRYYEEFGRLDDNEAAIIESTARVGGVMVAAGLIAALSFLSLATLGTDSMRTFGIFTAFGILSVLVIEMTMIPAVRAILGPPERGNWASEDRIHPRLNQALRYGAERLANPATARRILIGYAVVVLASVLLAQRIQVDTSFKRNFAPDDPVRQDDELLNRLFAGTNVLLFTVEGPVEGAIAEPAALRGMDAFARGMEKLPGVGKAMSVVDTLKQVNHALNPEAGADQLPASKDLATQYLFLYTLSGGNDLATRLTSDNRMAKIVVLLREDSTRYGDAVIAEARRIASEVLPPDYQMHVAGTLASNSALTETMVQGKILNVLQIGAITVLIATIVLRSFLAGLLVAVPLAIAVLINFGVMGATDIRLDVATSAVTAMAVGIGADYAVYFLFRMREEYAREGDFSSALSRSLMSSGKAILFVSSAVGLGYSVLCLSGFRLFVHLGALVGLAMVTSSLATMLVLPAMLTLIARTPWIRSVLGTPTATPLSQEARSASEA